MFPSKKIVKPIYMSVYPTMDSLQEVVDKACASLPIKYRNELIALLMTYQNTLLKELKD